MYLKMFHVKHFSQTYGPGVIPCAWVWTAFRACTCPPGAHYYPISRDVFCQEHFTKNFLVDNFPTVKCIEYKTIIPAETDKLLFTAPIFWSRPCAVCRDVKEIFGLVPVNCNLADEHNRGKLRKGIVVDIPVAPFAEIVFDSHFLKVTPAGQVV